MKMKRTGTLRGACFALILWLILAVPVNAASIALTFDDGPSGNLTMDLLKILEEEDIPATFFLCGYRLEQYGDAAAAIGATDHELGVHGFSHGFMSKMTAAELREDLESTCLCIMEKTGRTPTLLRPPGGLTCSGVQKEAALEGYPIILWSIDPEDWREGTSGKQIEERVLRQAEDGDIILMHDLNRRTLDALPGIIRQLKSRGFTFMTVSELAADKGVTLIPGESYCRIESPQ